VSLTDIQAAMEAVTSIISSEQVAWVRSDISSKRDPIALGFSGSGGGWRLVVARFTPEDKRTVVAYDGAAVCLEGDLHGTILHLTPELAETAWLQANRQTKS
jgi:hypothetical protein